MLRSSGLSCSFRNRPELLLSANELAPHLDATSVVEKRKQTRLSASCSKKQGAHPSTQEEAQANTRGDATEHGSRF